MRGRRFPRALFLDLPVKVICVTAAVILFLFHRVNALSERFFSVPLAVSTPSGLAIASAYPKTVRITLRGAGESINPILEEDVEATVNLDEEHGAGISRAQVKVSRKGTALNVEPLEIRVEPQEIAFTLEPLTERRVNVTPDLRGSPAYGYELLQSSIAPQSVVIRGARSRVQGVAVLPTEEIDLTGRTGSFASKVRILLPNALVKVAGEALVDFKATIQESIVLRTYTGVEMVGADLGNRLAFSTAPPQGSVQVQGSQLLVDGVRPEQVRLILDCSNVKRPGQVVMRPRPEAPSNVTVMDWSPRELTVEFVVLGR
jgi:hypothetical protein